MSFFNFMPQGISSWCFGLLIGAVLGLFPLIIGGKKKNSLRYWGFIATLLSGLAGGEVLAFVSATIFTVLILSGKKKGAGDSQEAAAENGVSSGAKNQIRDLFHSRPGPFVLFCGWTFLFVSQILSVSLNLIFKKYSPDVTLIFFILNLILSIFAAIPIIAGTWMSAMLIRKKIIAVIVFLIVLLFEAWFYITVLVIGMVLITGHGPQ